MEVLHAVCIFNTALSLYFVIANLHIYPLQLDWILTTDFNCIFICLCWHIILWFFFFHAYSWHRTEQNNDSLHPLQMFNCLSLLSRVPHTSHLSWPSFNSNCLRVYHPLQLDCIFTIDFFLCRHTFLCNCHDCCWHCVLQKYDDKQPAHSSNFLSLPPPSSIPHDSHILLLVIFCILILHRDKSNGDPRVGLNLLKQTKIYRLIAKILNCVVLLTY